MGPFEIRVRALIVKWRGYARTYQIATHLDMTTADARRRMKRLEAKGVVRRSKHSAVNDISWEMADASPSLDGEKG